ncbi:MAG: sigma-70 family RNA polymerase sigma factor [Terriglobia bacterium]
MLCDVNSTSEGLPQFIPFASPNPSKYSEESFFQTWNADIRRAAQSAARTAGLDPSDSDDLAQYARVRLLDLLRTRGCPPEPYARRVIANAVRTARRPHIREGMQSVATNGKVKSDPTVTKRPPTDLFVELAVKEFVQRLPEKLRLIYELVFEKGCTQREAALELKVTQPRIAQLEAELRERGRKELGDIFR